MHDAPLTQHGDKRPSRTKKSAPRHSGTPGPLQAGLLCLWPEKERPNAPSNSPTRKMRKTGAVDEDGNTVTIPRLPSVAGSNKPPRWNRWGPAEKVEHLLGLSLDRMHDYLWPADSLDPYRPAAQAQVIRVVAMVAAKVGKEARRARRAALGTLNRTLPGDCPEDAKPSDVKSPSHERTCRRTHSAKHARPCTYITQFKRVLVNK
jgi:hypothetical protein